MLDCFLDIGGCLLKSVALRLATLEFGAPSVKAVLILLNDYAWFADHVASLASRGEARETPRLLPDDRSLDRGARILAASRLVSAWSAPVNSSGR